jgi:hypothetical protein
LLDLTKLWRRKKDMWPLILAKVLKNWKVIVLGALVLGICAYVGILKYQLNQERESVELLTVKVNVCQMQNNSLVGQIQKQNEAVLALQTLADAKQKKLDELLSQPPKTIYRDRFTEIPTIISGDCETVMDALANYFGELTNVQ